MRIFRKLRENIKLLVWDYIDIVHNSLRYISIFVSFFTISIIAYFYGFQQTEQSIYFCNIIIHCSLIFYVLKYLISTIFSIHSTAYIKQHKFQGIMISFIIVWFLFKYVFYLDIENKIFSNFELTNISNITILIIQIYFFVLMLFDFSSIGQFFTKLKFGPGGWMIGSFLLLISTGTVLLMLPEMTTDGIRFIDALFISASASCVTGLTTLEVATAFTLKGHFVILMLIQLGGINIVCFATFLTSFYRGKNLRYQFVMKEMLSTTLRGTNSLIKEIFIYTFVIEIMGAIAFFLYWNHNQFYSDSIIENLFLSVFHAISAFNNAGISIIEGGMTSPLFRHEHYIQYITGFLIFLGGIGFITINDVFYTVTHNPHKKRFWTRLQVMSRIIVKMSLILIVVGTFAFFIFEFNNVSHGASLNDRISTAFFSTISCRTAGFALVDINLFSTPTIIIFLVLMLIGGSPSSTAGGIKITTFYILMKSAISTIRGKKEVSICNRAVPFSLVDRAYAVVLFSLTIIFFGTLILSISDPKFGFKEIIFEIISALGTVGLSTGITTSLSFISKLTLILIMFVGRITILTIAISVVRKAMYTNYSLAKTNLNL